MRDSLEEKAVHCMIVKFKYKTSPGWDALKNDTFPVSGFSNVQDGRKGESREGLGKWDQTLCEG